MHKYLDDAGIPENHRPWSWCGEQDPRAETWAKEREIYGFDSRETWSLDTTFYLWLYEHLQMFKDYSKIVDLGYHTFKYEGQEYTQEQLIDMMLERIRFCFSDEYDQNDPERYNYVHEIEKIWVIVLPAMWW